MGNGDDRFASITGQGEVVGEAPAVGSPGVMGANQYAAQVCRKGPRAYIPLALLVALVTLAGWPALAAGSTATSTTSDFGYAEVEYRAAPSETNDLTVVLPRDERRVEFTDRGVTIIPGPGCTGGGAPGEPVLCGLPRMAIDHGVDVALSDGDDRFDSTGLSASLPKPTDHPQITRQPLGLSIDAGDGEDVLRTGPSDDYIVPGNGDDRARGGKGLDQFLSGTQYYDFRSGESGTPLPDGADVLQGGSGPDEVTYVGREGDLHMSLDDEANDGAAGEGDNLKSITGLFGGLGDDVLIGNRGEDVLFGYEGDDRLAGRRGDDDLHGDAISGMQPGNDRLSGGGGNDYIQGYGGRDRLTGGRGRDLVDAASKNLNTRARERVRDFVHCGRGRRDRGVATRVDRVRGCEQVRRSPPF